MCTTAASSVVSVAGAVRHPGVDVSGIVVTDYRHTSDVVAEVCNSVYERSSQEHASVCGALLCDMSVTEQRLCDEKRVNATAHQVEGDLHEVGLRGMSDSSDDMIQSDTSDTGHSPPISQPVDGEHCAVARDHLEVRSHSHAYSGVSAAGPPAHLRTVTGPMWWSMWCAMCSLEVAGVVGVSNQITFTSGMDESVCSVVSANITCDMTPECMCNEQIVRQVNSDSTIVTLYDTCNFSMLSTGHSDSSETSQDWSLEDSWCHASVSCDKVHQSKDSMGETPWHPSAPSCGEQEMYFEFHDVQTSRVQSSGERVVESCSWGPDANSSLSIMFRIAMIDAQTSKCAMDNSSLNTEKHVDFIVCSITSVEREGEWSYARPVNCVCCESVCAESNYTGSCMREVTPKSSGGQPPIYCMGEDPLVEPASLAMLLDVEGRLVFKVFGRGWGSPVVGKMIGTLSDCPWDPGHDKKTII